MDKDLIFELLQQALAMFFKKEQRNLELDAHEICHAHRLAVYLEQQIRMYDIMHSSTLFEDYSIDLEFNRTEGGNVKELLGDNIRCDILIHSKGKNKKKENLLLLELKKENGNEEDKDRNRLKTMVSPAPDCSNNPIYNTLLGLFLKINRTSYSGTKYWYENGEVRCEDF